MRTFTKAFNRIARHFYKGWSVPDLEQASDHVRIGVSRLQRSQEHTDVRVCKHCDKEMTCPGVYVCDAGQAFEALKFSEITDALDELATKVKSNPVSQTVTVTHGKPFK